MDSHKKYMRQAIALSVDKMQAGCGGPFGAIIVKDDVVIGKGWNQVTSSCDPTAHAEVSAIRNACQTINNFSLKGATLYTSCEPCPCVWLQFIGPTWTKFITPTPDKMPLKLILMTIFYIRKLAFQLMSAKSPCNRLCVRKHKRFLKCGPIKLTRSSTNHAQNIFSRFGLPRAKLMEALYRPRSHRSSLFQLGLFCRRS